MSRPAARRHWWRELVTESWRCADLAWWSAMEDATSLYATEVAEYKAAHPRPLLRDHMVALKGSAS